MKARADWTLIQLEKAEIEGALSSVLSTAYLGGPQVLLSPFFILEQTHIRPEKDVYLQCTLAHSKHFSICTSGLQLFME
jgi:hypothetical protein